MHFNTKYIFQGDSQEEIVKKINHNFGQIISFSCGMDGHPGSKGPTGPYGPVGKQGASGPTGARATMWFRQFSQPLASESNIGDLWSDSNTFSSDVKILSATGSWDPTGYSLIFSEYFKAYDSVLGVAGVFEKYAIGINNSGLLSEQNTSFVVSDKAVSLLDSNPNRSKLVVSTSDQILRPVFSFIKTNRVLSGSPSFYWSTLGSSSSLTFRSESSFSINSQFSTTFLSKGSTGGSTVLPSASASFLGSNMSVTQQSTTGGIFISGTGGFSIFSNTTSGVGSNLSILSNSLILDSSIFDILNTSTESSGIQIDNSAGTSGAGSYSMSVTKTPTSSLPASSITTEFPTVLIDASRNDYALRVTQGFTGATASPVFSVSPRRYQSNSTAAEIGAPFISQTKFGGINPSATGGTAGPYFYHVKKFSRYILPIRDRLQFPGTFLYYSNKFSYTSGLPFLDLSNPSNFNSDIIVVGADSFAISNMYLKIPGISFDSGGSDLIKTYRIIYHTHLNAVTQSTPYSTGRITGLLWDSVYNGSPVTYILQFPTLFVFGASDATQAGNTSGEYFLDLTYMILPSGSKRVMYKTGSMCSGFIIL